MAEEMETTESEMACLRFCRKQCLSQEWHPHCLRPHNNHTSACFKKGQGLSWWHKCLTLPFKSWFSERTQEVWLHLLFSGSGITHSVHAPVRTPCGTSSDMHYLYNSSTDLKTNKSTACRWCADTQTHHHKYNFILILCVFPPSCCTTEYLVQ